jgi:hypothetical protein
MNWLKLSNKRMLCLVIFGFISTKTLAQKTLQEYKTIYPNYNELVLNDTQNYDITIADKKIKIIQDNHYESMILSENVIQNNKESFSYSELIKLKEYEAYTVINDNGKERKIKVTQTTEKQAQESAVFYNDVKAVSYTHLRAHET